MELRDPITSLLIPREWIDKSNVPFAELKKLVESGFYAVTSSGALLRRGLSTGTVAAAAGKAGGTLVKRVHSRSGYSHAGGNTGASNCKRCRRSGNC